MTTRTDTGRIRWLFSCVQWHVHCCMTCVFDIIFSFILVIYFALSLFPPPLSLSVSRHCAYIWWLIVLERPLTRMVLCAYHNSIEINIVQFFVSHSANTRTMRLFDSNVIFYRVNSSYLFHYIPRLHSYWVYCCRCCCCCCWVFSLFIRINRAESNISDDCRDITIILLFDGLG